MSKRALTDFQVDVLALAYEGLTNSKIAAAVKSTPGAIAVCLSYIKRKGHDMPKCRPREATAEKAHKAREKRNIAESKAAPRFTAKGVRKSTGERFEVT